MTLEQLNELLASSIEEIIKKVEELHSFPKLPKWSDLVKQYDPMKHNIWDTSKYPEKKNENNMDEFKRTALGLQKLAVKRVAQSMFSNPVQRKYNYNRENEQEKLAIDIIEEVYRTRNYIDSENIQRAKKLNSNCQIATIWRAYEKPSIVEEQISNLTLTHKTYCEKDGYTLYPVLDMNDEMILFGISYKDISDIEHFDLYVNKIDSSELRAYVNSSEGWIEDPERTQSLEIFPVVYANIDEPVWGGDEGTNLVEQLEEMESYQGLYIKRNALPTFTLDYGELDPGDAQSDTEEKSDDSRRIIEVGKGGNMTDVTWEGAEKAISSRYERLRNAFFEQIQVPDTSFANMIKSNTSADNKELIFADAKAYAKDIGGIWEKFLYEEMEIVKKMIAVMFSKFSKIYDTISVRSVLTPYSIKTRLENAEYVATAGSAMSMDTQVKTLGEVDDVNAEVEKIQEERSTSANLEL
jgi:hypothetical protein